METNEILAAIQKAAETIATPNWAAWLSAIAALGAVIVAIIIAIKQNKVAERQNEISKKQNEIAEKQTEIAEKQAKIAEQQNKIALFDKQYQVFAEIMKVIGIGQAIKTQPKATLKWVLNTALVEFGYDPTIDTADTGKTHLDSMVVSHNLTSIKRAVFLFPEIEKEDVNKLCDKFFRFFCELILEIGTHLDARIEQFTSTAKSDFITASEEINTKYHTLIIQNLYLTR